MGTPPTPPGSRPGFRCSVYEDYGTVGGARQVGVEYRGDYVAFTDADCIPGNVARSLAREFAVVSWG